MPLWTKEEIELLENNYAKKGSTWCANKLNRTWNATVRKASYLGIKGGNQWTDEETLYLIENSEKPLDDLAGKLKKSKEAVNQKLNYSQLKKSKNQKINISDKEFKEIVSFNNFDELSEEFNVHYSTLYEKILSIYPDYLVNHGEKWKPDEDNYLNNSISKYSRCHISINLKKSINSVEGRITMLGIAVQEDKSWNEKETKSLIKAMKNGYLEKFIKNSERSRKSINAKIAIINPSKSTQNKAQIKQKNWTEDEIKFLKDNYSQYGKEFCVENLNRTEGSIRYKAAELGLTLDTDSNHFLLFQQSAAQTKKGRKRPEQSLVMKEIHNVGKFQITDEQRKKISENAKRYIKLKGHPKGMLGKKHTEKAKQIMSKKSKERWKDPDYVGNSEIYRELLGIRMSELQTEGKLRQNYSRGKQGEREDLDGLYLRSSWEANIARYLNYQIQYGNVKEWLYEGLTYDIKNVKGSRTYTPDFNVIYINSDEIIHLEVKGWKDPKGMNKYNAFIEQYPQEKILLIDKDEYKKIKTSFAPQIKYWEY
jgi:hypothetical protein